LVTPCFEFSYFDEVLLADMLVCVLIKPCTVHLAESDEAFRPQRPLPFDLARDGLSAFVVFLFWRAGSWG